MNEAENNSNRAEGARAEKESKPTRQSRRAWLAEVPADGSEFGEDWRAELKAAMRKMAESLPYDADTLLRDVKGRRLTKEDQHALAAFAHGLDDCRCRNEMVQRFDALAGSVTARFRKLWPHLFPDLLQAARIGLLKAFDCYDPRSGAAFATAARYWVMNEVIFEALRTGGPCVLPMSPWLASVVRWRFSQAGWDAAAKAGISGESIAAARRVLARVVQLDGLDDDEAESALRSGFLYLNLSSDEEPIEDRVMASRASPLVKAAVDGLGAKERRILRARALSDEPKSLDQVSRKIGYSRERVRQLEMRAMEQLEAGLREADAAPVVDATGSETMITRLVRLADVVAKSARKKRAAVGGAVVLPFAAPAAG